MGNKHLKSFGEHSKNENLDLSDVSESKINNPSNLMDRVNKLVEFLDTLDDDTKVSAGDIMGYICGYFGDDDLPEDEIETFD
jgi:endo-1,4-beta-mannosidase